MKCNIDYESPRLQVLEISVENGFADSNVFSLEGFTGTGNGIDDF